jgi:hypothetical protein
MQERVMFKFEFIGRGGNNIFLDDFKITGTFSGEQLLKFPEKGAVGLASDVLLDWKAVGGVDFYEYQLDVNPDFTSANLISGTRNYIDETPENVDTEFEALGLNLATTYYWRVRNSANGALSDWSETWYFDVSETGVGLDEDQLRDEIKLFPNPAKEMAAISSSSVIESIQLIDYSGRKVLALENIVSNYCQIALSDISPGVYLVMIKSENGTQTAKRLIIR